MVKYVYAPLDVIEEPTRWTIQSLRSVRLLTVLPGEFSSPLHCILSHAKLSEDYERPTSIFRGRRKETSKPSSLVYEALSYAWGDASKTHSIHVKSGILIERMDDVPALLDDLVEKIPEKYEWQELGTTVNLYSALQHIRLKDKARLLWIDAVCIDQSNEKEKTQQVMIMDRIYSQADRVVVWLGESSPLPPPASNLELASESCSVRRSPPETNDSDFAFDVLEEVHGGHEMSKERRTAGRAALERLLKRPWWRRSWVVQEVLMAQQCIFVCGSRSISWQTMGRGISELEPFPSEGVTEWSTGTSEFKTPMLWSLKLNLGMSMIMQLPYLLGHLSTKSSSDPRDKIFSLVNLVAAGPNVAADYSKSTREVYIQVVQRCVLHKPNLSVITRHHTGFDPNGANELDLPSWVPNFSQSGGDGSLSWTVSTDWYYRDIYFADGRFQTEGITEFRFLNPFQQPGIMLGQGVRLDRIKSITEVTPDEAYVDGSDAWIEHVRRWEPPSVLAEEVYAKTTETALRAYWRTLVMDKYDLRWRYTQLSDEFAPWWRTDVCYKAWANHITFHYGWGIKPYIKKFATMLHRTTRGRRFAMTDKGYMVLVPKYAVTEDVIAVLLGGSAPFVLREDLRPEYADRGLFQLIGTCYVHGWMDGELIGEWKAGSAQGDYFPIH